MVGPRVLAVVSAFVVVVGACSDDAPSASPSTTTSSIAQSTTAPTTTQTSISTATSTTTVPERRHVATASSAPVVVLDAGAEPRRELRYGGGEGRYAFALHFDADGPLSVDVPGASDFEFDMNGGSADGGLVYTGTSRIDVAGSSPDLTPAAGSNQELRISRLGVLELDSPLTGVINDIAVSAIVTTLAIAVPPLPEEAVGIGARWTTRAPDTPTMTLLSTDTNVQLVEDSGGVIVLAVSSTGTGEEGFRGGLTNEIVETGVGRITVELSTATPIDGTIAYESVVTPVNPPAFDEPPNPPWESSRTFTVGS